MLFRQTSRIAVVLALALLLTACPAPERVSTRPQEIAVSGEYVHKSSGMVFPVTFGDFDRVGVTRYDPTGENVGVGYNCRNLLHALAATIYIYPAPGEGEFLDTKRQIQQAHPAAKVVEEHPI